MKYYDLTKIESKKTTYNLIIGERSNGKTYSLLLKVLKEHTNKGNHFAYVRRWQEDITSRRASGLFRCINEDDKVFEITNGKFKGVHYVGGKYYLCNYDETTGKPLYNDSDLLGFTFSLTSGEHDKSTSYPRITNIIFDEFLTSQMYLPDEFVRFMNVISTIVRQRFDVSIWMLGNTVNKYSPYFKEMGLDKVQTMSQGTIDVYKYGDSDLQVSVEYCETIKTNGVKKSNKYFSFNNPKLSMITGGAWELDIYPHLPLKYKPKDVLLVFFIQFGDNDYQGEIINIGDTSFIYIHQKTTPIRKPKNHIIYTLDHHPEPNYNRSIYKPSNKIQHKILYFFKHSKVFYQDNQTGDAINNYLKICKKG